MTKPRPTAFTLVQLVVVVFVLAVMLRVLMHDHTRVMPRQVNNTYPHNATPLKQLKGVARLDAVAPAADALDLQVGEVVTLSSLSPEEGPLLARMIQRHRPMTTEAQVVELVDTLPPSATPSVILILPSVEKPDTPPDQDKCAPHREAEIIPANDDNPRC